MTVPQPQRPKGKNETLCNSSHSHVTTVLAALYLCHCLSGPAAVLHCRLHCGGLGVLQRVCDSAVYSPYLKLLLAKFCIWLVPNRSYVDPSGGRCTNPRFPARLQHNCPQCLHDHHNMHPPFMHPQLPTPCFMYTVHARETLAARARGTVDRGHLVRIV